MSLRNPGRIKIDKWRGLDSFSDLHELTPDQWFDANNVVVSAGGGAEVLRSPKAFGSALTGFDDSDSSSPDPSSESSPDADATIISADEYTRLAGHLLFVDRGKDTFSYASNGTATGRRSDQAGDPWTSVNVNDRFQRIDGNEFIQYLTSLAAYRNGIDAPAAAPTISYVADDSSDSISELCEIENSLQVSYAYKNSTTGHIGPPSPISNVLGPTDTDLTVRVPVVASTQSGIDKIVFFFTLDGGSIPYLCLECESADIFEVSNSTGNVDIPLCAVDQDTLTPETLYNQPPPVDGTHMFIWKDRIVLLRGRFIQYSGWESSYAGNAYECWPPLNQVAIPNKTDVAVGGLSTQLGALIFGKADSYMISGYPSDKVSSPNNTIAVTEHMEPLNWKIGIYENGKDTASTTPFGVIWVDQAKRLRLWDLRSFPQEIGVQLREELTAMTGTLTARWHSFAKNAGYYILRNSTTMLMIMVYQDAEGKMNFGYGKSTIDSGVIVTCTYSQPGEFFFGAGSQMYKWLNPDLRGDGWPSDATIFFKTKVGNDGNFTYFHSLSLEGDNIDSSFALRVNDQVIPLENDIDADTSWYGVVDQEARRHTMEFRFNKDDSLYRAIDSAQLFMRNKKRVI